MIIKMTIDNFLQTASYRKDKPFEKDEWKEVFKFSKYLPLFEKHIPTGEIQIFTGLGFQVLYTEHHDYGCEYYNHKWDDSQRFFTIRKEAEKFMKDLENSFSDYKNIKLTDGIFYIKAVKQNNHIEGGLF